MWSRSILKSNAKIAIGQGRYWTCFAVLVVATLLPNIVSVIYSGAYNQLLDAVMMDPYAIMDKSLMSPITITGWVGFFITLFVANPMIIGTARFFVRNRFGNTDFNTVLSGFKDGYGTSVGAMFTTSIFIGLWTLLFIVPGIIKSLEYTMVEFVLSDNPHINGTRARQISRTLTLGNKGGIFVLILSFFGWTLLPAIAGSFVMAISPVLGSIVSLVGMWFIQPYIRATFAELYIFLRDRAIQNGMLNPAELGLAAPEAPMY